jgi:hypothetical protein
VSDDAGTFYVWEDEDGWRFRLDDSDGTLLARSVKIYPTKDEALVDIAICQRSMATAPLVDQTEGEGDEQ